MIDNNSLIAWRPAHGQHHDRNLEDELKGRPRVRAARHGRSMEDEARDMLRTALASERQPPRSLAAAIRRRFLAQGGVDLPAAPREAMREPPDFGR